MGYTIAIGNATSELETECFPELSVRFVLERADNEDAPLFPNDPTERTNYIHPSYLAWADFCRKTGLHQLFYSKPRGFLNVHPGCVGITGSDLVIVRKALAKYKKSATLPPGFVESVDDLKNPQYDGALARLIWLEYWMSWALKYCGTPAIYNG